MEHTVYNQKGEQTGTITLPESVFGAKWNADLVHQVVTSMASSARAGTAHTKTRGEVRGGGKKPWRQKGTGRARHGSIRSPIWVGGGVAHGPRSDKNYSRKVNRGARRAAFLSVLSRKFKEGEVLFLDAIAIPEIKTAEAQAVLRSISGISGFEKLGAKSRNAAFIALSQKNRVLEKSFRNFGNVAVGETRNLNLLQVLSYKYLVVVNPDKSVAILANRK